MDAAAASASCSRANLCYTLQHAVEQVATPTRHASRGAEAARVEYVTNALGYVSIYSYDDADNLMSIEDPLVRVTHYLYDTNQWLTAIILPNGSVSSNVYDALGRVIETISPDGTRIGTDYDNLDRAVRTIFLSESAASGQRNINGHPYNETMYGCCGVLASIDRAGRMTSYEYDAAGRLLRVTDAELNTVSYAYDARDNLVTLTDGNGNSTAFEYDDFYLFYQSNRYLSAIEFPGGNRRTFSYAEIPRTVTWSNYWRQDLRTTELTSAYCENERLAGWAVYGQNAAMDFLTDTDTWTRARYLEPAFVPGSRWAAPYTTYYYTWRNEKPVLAVRSHDTPWLVSDAWQPTNYNNSVYIEVFWGTSVTVTDENGAHKEYQYSMDGALINAVTNGDTTTARALYYNRFLDQNLRQVAFGASFGDNISFLYDALGQLLYSSTPIFHAVQLRPRRQPHRPALPIFHSSNHPIIHRLCLRQP
ncbi:MAG: hypothetical protein NTV22_12285 [bacterium]|nr:hypothetical protein [bacterium]